MVAYMEGHGEAPIRPQPEFFSFMGSDSGYLSLGAQPNIRRLDDLKGKTLSVDARTRGFTGRASERSKIRVEQTT
jgi:hypothetical protein